MEDFNKWWKNHESDFMEQHTIEHFDAMERIIKLRIKEELTSMTQERDAAVGLLWRVIKDRNGSHPADTFYDILLDITHFLPPTTPEPDTAEGLLRDFIASTDNAGTYMAGDRVPSCGCCQRQNHHPNCPVLRAKAFLAPTPPQPPSTPNLGEVGK